MKILPTKDLTDSLSGVLSSPMTKTSARAATEKMSVTNIVRVYRESNESQIARGLSWYSDAHTFALSLDPNNIERSAGIIAALSPRIDWTRNMVLASRVYVDGEASGTLPSNCSKATRIFQGEGVFDVLGGNKVRNFAKCIIDPTDSFAVAIDRHAFDIAYGSVCDDGKRSLLSRKGVYDHVASLYVKAAKRVGVSPSQMQAITWTTWRENYSAHWASNVRRINGE